MVHSLPAATENRLVALNSPPSLPAKARTTPPALVTRAACQSAWTYGSGLLTPAQGVLPPPPEGSQWETFCQLGLAGVPLSVRMPHRFPPAKTWSGLVGSTA